MLTLTLGVAQIASGAALRGSTQQYVSSTHSDTLTFEQTSISLTGIHGGNASWFDYDNDADLDILLAGVSDSGYVTKIYTNENGVFVPSSQLFEGLAPEHNIVWGDYDNDGDFDFFIAGVHTDTNGAPLGSASKIFRNDHGIFTDINAPIIGLRGGGAAWGDYDNDGDLDLIVTGSPDNGSTFRSILYRNDGGEFTEVTGTPFPGMWGASVAWGDYDNDGDVDLLMSGWAGYGVSTLFRNDGGGVFTEVSTPFIPEASSTVAFADYDNDGDLDVIITGTVSGGAGMTKLYRNNGDGTFTDTNAPLLGLGVGAVAWGDIDNDGDLDLIISGAQNFDGSNPTTVVYRNDGGTFTQLPDVLQGGWFCSLSLGDYDNDGRLDLIFTGATTNTGDYGRKTIIYRNIFPVQNSVPTAPTNLSATVTGTNVQFQWDRASDSQTATNALTYNLRVGQSQGAIDIVAPNSNVGTGFRRIPEPGNANSVTSLKLNNLSPGTYYWNVQSVDRAYAGSAFASERSFTIEGAAAWELLSLPYHYPDPRKNVLFPNSASNAFSYDGSYHIATDLGYGEGYWLKFTAQHPYQVQSGSVLDSVTIPVRAGWNLIGSLSAPLPVSSIVRVGTSLTSPYFGYAGSYSIADTLEPGYGYWIKANHAGSLVLNSAVATPSAYPKMSQRSSIESLNMMTFENSKGSQHLYFGNSSASLNADWFELPPVPPQANLDVRFADQRMLETFDGGAEKEFPVRITSTSYPVIVSWNIVTPVEGVITSGTQSASLAKSGSIRVESADSRVSLRFTGSSSRPVAFSLEQNYPNPFNPATVIRYNLPARVGPTFLSDYPVSLKVYDMLGRVVATLVDGTQAPGEYSVKWDATNAASGMYFYELRAGSFRGVQKMVLVR